MSEFPLRRPLLPSHYRVLLEPPDDKGDETLTFVSVARRVKLRGQAFREFHRLVLPRLDGQHSLDDIAAACDEEFSRVELEAALALLARHGLLRDAAAATAEDPARAPQWNQWHDLGVEPAKVQRRLRSSTVAVLGLAGAGAVAAQSLAAAGVGSLRLFDTGTLHPADAYLAANLAGLDTGLPRAQALASRLHQAHADVALQVHSEAATDDDGLAAALQGVDFVLCTVDDGRSTLAYRLNRVCLALKLPWLAAGTWGLEAWVGPLMRPPATACYLCFRMRMVAASENPEDDYALASHLDRLRRDDTARHESLVFGEGIAGQLAALETVKALAEMPAPAAAGHCVVLDLVALTSTRHKVLRKPFCPACGHLAWGDA